MVPDVRAWTASRHLARLTLCHSLRREASQGMHVHSVHVRHHEFCADADTGRPAARDRFQPCIESHSFRSMHMVVTKDRSLPATERMKRHWDWDWYVDSDHTDLDLVSKFAGG